MASLIHVLCGYVSDFHIHFQLKEYEAKLVDMSRERDQLIKQRDAANQEAHMWRSELAKAREQAVILEGAIVRAEEKVRVTEADAEARTKEAKQKELAALQETQELMAYINRLQAQIQRFIIFSPYFPTWMQLFLSLSITVLTD